MNPEQRELLLCIPGPWEDRSDFVCAVVSETKGEFMFAGTILANPGNKDNLPLDFAPQDAQMRHAFVLAGQGKLSAQLPGWDHHRKVTRDHLYQRAETLRRNCSED